MTQDRGIATDLKVGMIMGGNTWLAIAIILVTSLFLLHWKRARERQLVHEMELEDESVIINTPVFGEEQIQGMPGPGNQPPFQFVMGMLSTRSSCGRGIDEICHDGHLDLTSLSQYSDLRNPQGRAPYSDTDDDDSDHMSTAHVQGTHPPGETCTICNAVPHRYGEQNFLMLAAHRPILHGMPLFQLAPPGRTNTMSSVSGVATPDLPTEGTGEANHTFSTFIVSPRVGNSF